MPLVRKKNLFWLSSVIKSTCCTTLQGNNLPQCYPNSGDFHTDDIAFHSEWVKDEDVGWSGKKYLGYQTYNGTSDQIIMDSIPFEYECYMIPGDVSGTKESEQAVATHRHRRADLESDYEESGDIV